MLVGIMWTGEGAGSVQSLEVTRSSYRGDTELEITMLAHSYHELYQQTLLKEMEQRLG